MTTPGEGREPYSTPLPDFLATLRDRGVALHLDDDGALQVEGWRRVNRGERARLRDQLDQVVALLAGGGEGAGGQPGTADDPEAEPEVEPATKEHDAGATARRPHPGEYTAGRGLEHWWRKYGRHIPQEDLTDAEIIAGRRAFMHMINRKQQ